MAATCSRHVWKRWRNSLRGPAFFQSDLSVAKSIPLEESVSLQFRADIFNLFNKVNLDIPQACVDCLDGGTIINTAFAGAALQRQIMFSLRLDSGIGSILHIGIMRHCIAIAVIGAALLPLELQAQLRGAPAMRAAPTPRMSAPMVRPAGGGVMRPGLAGPIRFVPGRGVPLRAGFGRPVLARRFMMSRHFGRRHFRFFANQCFNGFIDPFFCRRFFFRNSFFFSPFVGVPAYYGYPYDYSNPAVQPVAAQSSSQDNELGYEVQRLSDELEQLREEESLRREPPSPASQSPPQAQTEEKATPTTLVFNDGQRTDVQNYAIIGKTLWIFTEQRAKKIPLSELNLATTRKTNAERGVEFAVPESQP